MIYVIYLSAEINHWNHIITGTMLFRIQQKNKEILDEIMKTKKISPCDLN